MTEQVFYPVSGAGAAYPHYTPLRGLTLYFFHIGRVQMQLKPVEMGGTKATTKEELQEVRQT